MGAPGRKRTCGCAIPSVTLAGFLSVFASALVLSLLAEAALRGLGVTMPSPVHGRKWKPAALVEHGSGVTPSGSSLVRAGPRQVLANTDRHGLTFPIVEKGLPVSGNGTSWRLESRGNVTVDEGILDGRVQARFPRGVASELDTAQAIVFVSSSSFPAEAKSLSGIFSGMGTSDSKARAKTLQVQFGCQLSNESESWSGSVLLHTAAANIARGMRDTAEIPIPDASTSGCRAFDRVRIRSVACDRWGHVQGEKDCDPTAPPESGVLGMRRAELKSKPVLYGDCDSGALLAGKGWSCDFQPGCQMSSLYRDIFLPRSGQMMELKEMSMASGEDIRLVPDEQMGTAQGINCGDMLENVLVGCKLSRGYSTHKSVYQGVYLPEEMPVVVKEGGVRYPAPRHGERGVGFRYNEDLSYQQASLSAMWFEMMQEITVLEHLKGHPAIPKQYGACVDVQSKVATSIQSAANIKLSNKQELADICRRHRDPGFCAVRLANSSAELFRHTHEERMVRIEDLHWGEQFAQPGTVDAKYGRDDISQFAIDDDESLNLQPIDLDKVSIDHDKYPHWYLQQYLMPFVAERIYEPLIEVLPALEHAFKVMKAEPMELRPMSFECLTSYFSLSDIPARLGRANASTAPSLPCERPS